MKSSLNSLRCSRTTSNNAPHGVLTFGTPALFRDGGPWTNVFLSDCDVVEVDHVLWLLRPTVRYITFKRKGIGKELGIGAPIDAAPVPTQLAVDPICLLAVIFTCRIVKQHEFDADPLAALNAGL